MDSTSTALAPGQPVAIVLSGAASIVSARARVARRRDAQCDAAFPQPRWDGYAFYDLTLIDSIGSADLVTAALAVASDVPWTLGADSLRHADLDRDGIPEEARRCAAHEGEHFTIWSRRPNETATRRAHEYFDWGALVDPTCRPGEDGQDGDK